MEKKIVLISKTGYSPQHDKLLMDLLNKGIELFSAWGKDCKLWEEVMDELAVGDGSNPISITTTSHPDEPIEDVLNMANCWTTDPPTEVKIIEI